jgi:hypothetical protein
MFAGGPVDWAGKPANSDPADRGESFLRLGRGKTWVRHVRGRDNACPDFLGGGLDVRQIGRW